MTVNEILQRYFLRKKERLPQFSLRTLALHLEVSPAYLSRILKGQKSLPEHRWTQFVEVLEIDDTGQAQLQRARILEKISDQSEQKILSSLVKTPITQMLPSEDFSELSVKKFFLLEEWYYLPILDLISCHDFSAEPKWIAQRLDLAVPVVERAWQKLLQMKCIEERNGAWVKVDGNIRFPTTKSHPVIRSYHKSFLKKAYQEINTKTNENDFSRRMFKGGSVATNKESVAKAKEILDAAIFEAMKVLCEGEADDVYHLSLQIFPLTMESKKS